MEFDEQKVDVSDFLFKALRKIRFCDDFISDLCNSPPPSWLAVSSKYGIVVTAKTNQCLVSMRSTDIHCCQATTSNIHVEVNDLQCKQTHLPVNSNDRLVSLSCDSSERYLSAFVNTSRGCFVYIYDICALSVDHPHKADVFCTIRLSTAITTLGLSLKWTTAAEPVFAVSLLDGTLSVISIDRQVLNKFTIIATVQLNCNAICISWSPKGQQLVIGDTGGNIKQYKPDLVIVRTIPLPNDQYSVKRDLSQCVGICWLTTTDFLVAYSTKRYMEVFVSLICAKKGVPIKYTHFDDIIFCGNESPFQQQITFLYLIQWKMVLVASSRSSEIAVIGKRNDKWKVWVMDDNERIELPVNKEYKESFPLGLAIDYSSIISVKLDEANERLPCPIVILLSSNGLLLPFNAVNFDESRENLNKPSEILPSLIYMSSTKESTQENSTYNKTSASSFSFTFPESVVNSTPSQQKSPANVKVAVISTTLKSPLNIQEASTTSEVPFSFSFPAAPETNVIQTDMPMKTKKSLITQNISAAVDQNLGSESKRQQNIISKTVIQCPSEEETITRQKRQIFYNKVACLTELLSKIRDNNEWIADLKYSIKKNLPVNSCGPGSPEWIEEIKENFGEVQEIAYDVQNWINCLEIDIKDCMILLKERVNSRNLEDKLDIDSTSNHVLSFNKSYQLNKIEEKFREIKQMMQKIDNSLAIGQSTCFRSLPSFRKSPFLNVDEEEKIVQTARNICKGIINNRKELTKLQQDVIDLEARFVYLSAYKRDCDKSLFGQKLNGDKLLASQHPNYIESSFGKIAQVLTARNKSVSPSKEEKKSSNLHSDILSKLEARLFEATLSSFASHKPIKCDIGTQSHFSVLSGATMITPHKEISTAYSDITSQETNFAADSTVLPPALSAKETSKTITIKETQQKIKNEGVKSADSLIKQETPENIDITQVSVPISQISATAEMMKSSKSASQNIQISAQFDECSTKSSFSPCPNKLVDTIIISKDMSNSKKAISISNSDVTVSSLPSNILAHQAEESNENTTSTSVQTVSKDVISPVPNASLFGVTKNIEISATMPTKPLASNAPVTFSFSLPSEKTATVVSTYSTNTSLSADATTNDNDIGMMEADDTSIMPSNLFSSSLSGVKKNSTDASKNVFGVGLNLNSSSFASSGQSNSVFDAAKLTIFDGGQSTGSIYGENQSPGSTFRQIANNPVFGGGASFGGKASFITAAPVTSMFNQSKNQSSGFAAFARSGISGFGSLAANQQSNQSSVFSGNTGFSSLSKQGNNSSIFGGGLQNTNMSSSSFSTWR